MARMAAHIEVDTGITFLSHSTLSALNPALCLHSNVRPKCNPAPPRLPFSDSPTNPSCRDSTETLTHVHAPRQLLLPPFLDFIVGLTASLLLNRLLLSCCRRLPPRKPPRSCHDSPPCVPTVHPAPLQRLALLPTRTAPGARSTSVDAAPYAWRVFMALPSPRLCFGSFRKDPAFLPRPEPIVAIVIDGSQSPLSNTVMVFRGLPSPSR